jgi:hypothetical protein
MIPGRAWLRVSACLEAPHARACPGCAGPTGRHVATRGISHTTEEESLFSLPVGISITRGQGVSDDAVCAVPVCPLSACAWPPLAERTLGVGDWEVIGTALNTPDWASHRTRSRRSQAGPGSMLPSADLTVRQPFENWTGGEEREGMLNTMCGRSLHCKCRQPNGLNVLRLVRSGDLGPASSGTSGDSG